MNTKQKQQLLQKKLLEDNLSKIDHELTKAHEELLSRLSKLKKLKIDLQVVYEQLPELDKESLDSELQKIASEHESDFFPVVKNYTTRIRSVWNHTHSYSEVVSIPLGKPSFKDGGIPCPTCPDQDPTEDTNVRYTEVTRITPTEVDKMDYLDRELYKLGAHPNQKNMPENEKPKTK